MKKVSNSDICKILMNNEHLSKEDKQTLLKALGYEEEQEEISFSDRISDKFTNFIGSWNFIIISCLFIALWMIVNSFILPEVMRFDDYPYTFLNLVLACIAAIQAPIIMMSQNRQDKRESLKTQSDYEIDLKTIVIIQELYKKVLNMQEKINDIDEKLK